MAWSNGPLTVYHATIGLSANDIEQRGVDLTKCRLGTDFDQGFYTTGIRNQANLFANQKYQDEILKYNRRPLPHPLHAAVVEFSLDRGTLGRLDTLAFVVDRPDWLEFVQHCRLSAQHGHKPSGSYYDVVYGPVSNSRYEAIPGFEQLSFHTRPAIAILRWVDTHRGNPAL